VEFLIFSYTIVTLRCLKILLWKIQTIHTEKVGLLYTYIFDGARRPRIWLRKLSNFVWSSGGYPKFNYLKLLCGFGKHVRPLVPAVVVVSTNLHWGHVVGYGPFSLCVVHKEGLCPSSGDINRLMIIFVLIPITLLPPEYCTVLLQR
jgi:hypothetical protein